MCWFLDDPYAAARAFYGPAFPAMLAHEKKLMAPEAHNKPPPALPGVSAYDRDRLGLSGEPNPQVWPGYWFY